LVSRAEEGSGEESARACGGIQFMIYCKCSFKHTKSLI